MEVAETVLAAVLAAAVAYTLLRAVPPAASERDAPQSVEPA